jgi:pyrroloquinoline quinone biosynthesis protein D
MTEPAPATAVPAFPAHVRFQFDAVRDRWVVLAPERMFVPDEQATEILKLVDGNRDVRAIAADLAARYAAPEDVVLADVAVMLADLAARGAIRLA